MDKQLYIGTAEIDITPGDETIYLAGSLHPEDRPARGTHDPLYVRAIVLESGGVQLAYVIFDVAMLEMSKVKKYVQKASDETGIPADNIIWSCTHTHSAPVTTERLYPKTRERRLIDYEWLDEVLNKFVSCVKEAWEQKVPAKMSRTRGFNNDVSFNRRILFKDKTHINAWLLQNADEEIQSLGSAGPIDPEIGILAFDDENDNLLAVMYNFSCHANRRTGFEHSADYPGVVSKHLKEKFGPKVVSLYLPGACGDINPARSLSCDEIGNQLSECIIGKLEHRKPIDGSIRLGSQKQTLTVPFRDLNEDQEQRLLASKWRVPEQEYFRQTLQELRDEGNTEIETVVQSWHIGEVAFASIPGELFVEWGLKIKGESPFPWTYPVELSGDWIGYLITKDAWEHGGYEGLTAKTAPVSVKGVEMLVNASLKMLNSLVQ